MPIAPRSPLVVVAAFACTAVCSSTALAQPKPVRVVTAVRAVPAPVIDGRLDDPVWAAGTDSSA